MQATLTVRTDEVMKARFTSLCEQFGMSANTAINVFINAVVENMCIPFTIGHKQNSRDRLERALEANRQERIRLNLPELTMEEIDAEIAACRAERYAKRKQQETAAA